jgi:hypothetical protein
MISISYIHLDLYHGLMWSWVDPKGKFFDMVFSTQYAKWYLL